MQVLMLTYLFLIFLYVDLLIAIVHTTPMHTDMRVTFYAGHHNWTTVAMIFIMIRHQFQNVIMLGVLVLLNLIVSASGSVGYVS